MLDRINEQGVSIIISARNEFPQIALTINDLMHDMDGSGITRYEFIIADNGSTDETSRFFAWKPEEKGTRWKYMYSPRGLVTEGILKIIFDPVYSNVGARSKAVKWAKYKNIIFADAHITVKHGTILSTLTTLDTYGGIVHAPVSWAGASSIKPHPGYQYSYKIGEKGPYGTWNSVQVSDRPFYIPICGHCWLAVKKEEFVRFKGYPLAQRVYGGGEPYLDTKWWMLGSTSMCDPNSLVYHLSAGRGYNWHSNQLLHNTLLVSYILGGEKWVDRIMITYLNKPGTNLEVLNFFKKEIMEEGKEDKEWLDANKIRTFEEVLGLDKEDLLFNMTDEEKNALNEDWYCRKCTKRGYSDPHVMRSWDYANDGLHGTHRSFVSEFRLRKVDNQIYIGNTPITNPDAIALANKYI